LKKRKTALRKKGPEGKKKKSPGMPTKILGRRQQKRQVRKQEKGEEGGHRVQKKKKKKEEGGKKIDCPKKRLGESAKKRNLGDSSGEWEKGKKLAED